MLSSSIVRRIGLLTAALFAATLHAPAVAHAQRGLWRGLAEARWQQAREGGSQAPLSQKPPPTDPPQPPRPQTQPPIFRGGTNLVQVDAIVTDQDSRPLVDLTASDFTLLDDGKPVTIDRVRFLGAAEYSGDATLAPIRSHEDEEREASRDDVRVYAIVLDDYHVQRMGELRVIEPLLAFVGQLPPTDLVGVFYPLDSVTDVAFTRDREKVVKAVRAFYGRRGDYSPRHPVEEEHLRHPREIELIRRQIVTSALEGLATHLGGIKQGRKTIIFVSEGFALAVDAVRDLYQAANRANVAFYPVDPRGLTMSNGRTTSRQMMNGLVSDRDALETLASETGGRAIVQKNDISAALGQVIRDSRAYYLIAYESPHPDDGKFHQVTVRVKRPQATVFARTGYWAYQRGENTIAPSPAAAAVPPAVQAAVDRLADSLRPDADEPSEGRRRVIMPKPADATAVSGPTIALARGRIVGEPVARREFHRTDTLVIRAPAGQAGSAAPATSGRLLDRRGQPLTELPLAPGADIPELRLALGNLGPGDYVIQLGQQYIAFRVVR
jgi:VWFA-related protein